MLDPRVDRRRHVTYVTQHTEYHCRGRECVGVRNRRTGEWVRDHGALRGRLAGATDGGSPALDGPPLGLRLLFVGREGVLTSRVEAMLRPPKEVLARYASRAAAGSIRGPSTAAGA
ncbi:MAG: hypothetical protein IPL40_00235 [Proteobacteria bacterium]|nr:hypothetical protein [Pseudomonadota bacterium]